MKTWQKAAFIIILILFVTASIVVSLISISRPTYKFTLESAEDGGAVDGWMFYAFNGNVSSKVLYLDYVRDKNGNNPDETKPVLGVRGYAVNADEYIEEIVIGASVRYIDETAFYNVKMLQKVTVDPVNEYFTDVDGVLFTKDGKELILYPLCYKQQPTDEEDVFTYPDAYTVPDGVERINTFAFLKNENLRDVTLPQTVKEIGDMAFFGCSRLGAYEYDAENDALTGTGFALPDSLESIGSDAFSKCGGLAPVLYIPSSVKVIRHHAFFSCGGLKEVYLGAADETRMETGDAWMPKSIKAGAMWKAPDLQYNKTRADCEPLIRAYKTDTLKKLREEAQKNG